jgi:hypothetical protein
MALSGVEFEIVDALAWPLPRDRRGDFHSAVEHALLAWPEQARGAGLTHRIAADLQKRFFDPPPKVSTPQLFNKRKHPLGAPLHHGREV